MTSEGYQGFIVDIVEEISGLANLTYRLVESEDDRYGVEQAGARAGWTGLVGLLLSKEIDVIAADLTVTASRLTVMDFSQPFMSSSITFLLKVSECWKSPSKYIKSSLIEVNPIYICRSWKM